MKKEHHNELVRQICDFMGEDLNGEVCREVAEHLRNCPQCQVQFDSVKRTVSLYRRSECDEHIPEDVNNRLLKVLNLDKTES